MSRHTNNRQPQDRGRVGQSDQSEDISTQHGQQSLSIGSGWRHSATKWLPGWPKVCPTHDATTAARLQGDPVQLEPGEPAGSTAKRQVVGDLWRPATEFA